MIDLNDILRVVFEWDGAIGTLAQLVWHYRVTAGNNEDPDDVLADIVTNFESAWANIDTYISDKWLSSTVELYQRDTALHQWDGVATTTSLNLDGATAADALPQGCAALVKVFTESARRQARKYVPGFIESQVTDGVILTTPLVALALFVADLDDSITSGTETLVFGTYNTLATSVLYETFSQQNGSAQVEANIAYQRRRRPGTGI